MDVKHVFIRIPPFVQICILKASFDPPAMLALRRVLIWFLISLKSERSGQSWFLWIMADFRIPARTGKLFSLAFPNFPVIFCSSAYIV